MKKQQNFNNLTGALLLVAALVGIFIFASKPKPAEIIPPAQPTIVENSAGTVYVLPKTPLIEEGPKPLPAPVKPQPIPEIPKPVPQIVKPKPPAEVVQPKPVPPPPKPKPVVVAPKPKVIPEISKPAETPKVVEKKVVAAEKPKQKISLFNIFKPKPKPVAPAPLPKVPAPVIAPAPLPKPIIITAPPVKGKIAIVLDDWGYNKNNFPLLNEIKYPITGAVLPNLSYSRQAAAELHKRGFEVILHLPMQPQGDEPQEKNTILTSLTDNEIRKIVSRDLSEIAYAKGANNHMGSLATEDPRVMEDVFSELKRRRLYFLDSFVTPKSICLSSTNKINIPFARRDVFLDNDEDPDYIKQQLNKLKEVASQQGYAVGIGHDRNNTVRVLIEVMPEIAKEGFEFVPLSEIVKK